MLPEIYLFDKKDRLIPENSQTIGVLCEYPRNCDAQMDGIERHVEVVHSVLLYLIPIIFKLFGSFIELFYLLLYHHSPVLKNLKSPFFKLVWFFCTCLSTRTLLFLSILSIFASTSNLDNYKTIPKAANFLAQFSKWVDWSGDFLSMQLIFLMALNRCAYFMNYDMVDKVFKKSRIIILVSFCILISATASVIMIQTSEMQRIYIPRVGFVDAGSPGYHMLINRLFYIFPVGSIICYVVLLFHMRQVAQRAISTRAAKSGEQKVFIQLLITICFYGAMCIVFEVINFIDWHPSTAEKIDLVTVLNIINYLPEISLPLMLLLSNTDMRRRISTIMAPRGSQSRTVSVIPVT